MEIKSITAHRYDADGNPWRGSDRRITIPASRIAETLARAPSQGEVVRVVRDLMADRIRDWDSVAWRWNYVLGGS